MVETNLKSQVGRSMVETLSVLAIIGVLSSASIAGFKTLMNKNRSNTIINDAKIAYTDIRSMQFVSDTNWRDISYRMESGKTFQVMRDKKNNNYVKIKDVEKEVCNKILNMATQDVLTFLKEDYTEMTGCEENNNIVMVWYDTTKGAPAVFETVSDCGENFAGICTNQGHCRLCDTATERMNSDGTACECDIEKAVSCTDGENTWCCGAGLICDTENKGCKESDGKCTYYFNESDETSEYTTDCSYTLSDESNVEYYYSNCYYTVGSTPSTTTQTIGNTTQSFSNPNLNSSALRGGCPENQYCTLLWTGTPIETQGNKYIFASKPTLASAGMTGTLYGKCQTLSGNDTTPLTENKNGSGQMIGNGARGGCPENQYCLLMWKQQSWTGTTEPKLTASDTGEMYGKCQTLSGNDATPKIAEGSIFTRYRVGQGCPIGQYCRLLWKNESCTNLAASDTGGLSGVCLSLSGPTPGTIDCPYKQ